MLQPTSQTQTWMVDLVAGQASVDDMGTLPTIHQLDYYSYSKVKVVTLPDPSTQSEVEVPFKPVPYSNTVATTALPQNFTSTGSESANGMLTCNSPESGFGSEHQYSPKESFLNVNVPECLPVEEPSDMLQIVSVTSLAEQNVSMTDDLGQDFSIKCERSSIRKICQNEDQITNRLHIRLIDNKQVLKLDWSTPVTADEPILQTKRLRKILDHAETCRHSNHQVLFGVPALTCCRHKMLKLSDLDDSENWPLKRQQSSVESVACESIPDAKNVSASTICRDVLPTRRFSKRKEAASKVLNHNAGVETNRQTNAIPPKRAVKNTNDKPLPSRLPETETTVVKGERKKVPPEKVSKKSTKTQPLSRIERLKEVLRKREEDLEKVRRSCGFIS